MNLPPYSIFPNLIGEKISLRQIENSDLATILEISFYDGEQATSGDIAAEMQAKIDADYRNGNSIHWGIIENSTHKITGTCGYYRGFEDEKGELGCVLLSQFQGKGFMTEAMSLAIEFGFNEMKLKRIWAATNKENLKAIKLLERLNFREIEDLSNHEVKYELNLKFSL